MLGGRLQSYFDQGDIHSWIKNEMLFRLVWGNEYLFYGVMSTYFTIYVLFITCSVSEQKILR